MGSEWTGTGGYTPPPTYTFLNPTAHPNDLNVERKLNWLKIRTSAQQKIPP
jgi:hypothetical protein